MKEKKKKFFSIGEVDFWGPEKEEKSMKAAMEYLLDHLSIKELEEIIEIQAKKENYMFCKAIKDKIEERRAN